MTSANPAKPPRGYFSIAQRMLRGYGPLAVFLVTLLLVAVMIPSKAQERVSSTGTTGGSGPSSGGTTNTTTGGPGTTAGRTGDPTQNGNQQGNQGAAVPTPQGAEVGPCTGRAEQIPGDPYSPPASASRATTAARHRRV